MIIQVIKNKEVQELDTDDILHYSISISKRSQKPTVYAVMENRDHIPICERNTIKECSDEVDEVLNSNLNPSKKCIKIEWVS